MIMVLSSVSATGHPCWAFPKSIQKKVLSIKKQLSKEKKVSPDCVVVKVKAAVHVVDPILVFKTTNSI